MTRIDKIATATSSRKRRNWFNGLPTKEQAELLEIRTNWHLGKPALNGAEMCDLIKQYFPKIKVGPKELYQWLRKTE